MSSNQPIGVFDSGVGGLSVLRAIRDQLPHESLVYVADSGHAPYGDRSSDFIEQRADVITEFLRSEGVKAVVVACNTVTATSIATLRAKHPLPITAIEPAVKPAVAATRTGVVGVLATSATLSSAGFARLLDAHGRGARVVTQACPGLAEQIERGDLEGGATRALVTRYLAPLLDAGADVVVLGCTHYPFLRAVIESVAGPTVTILDPADAVARELARRLREADLLLASDERGAVDFRTTGQPEVVAQVVSRLWQEPVAVRPMPLGAAS